MAEDMVIFRAKALDLEKLTKTIMCYSENIYRFNGVWDGPDPLVPIIPLFFVQLTASIFFTRLVVFLLKPFNQPAFVGQILGGIILGPSFLGRISGFRQLLYPNFNYRVLEPLAHYTLCYYAFLTGLQMDLKGMFRTEPKALNIAIAGMAIPFVIGSALFFVFDSPSKMGFIFWGAALAATGSPVLAKILSRQRLIYSETGKTVLGAANLSEMGSWILLSLGLALTNSSSSIHWALLCNTGFVFVCFYYLRPALEWLLSKTPEGHSYSEFYICAILTGVAFCGIITDAFGTHPIVGAFVFGLIMPNESLRAAVLDRLEDIIMGVLMPVFYVISGLRVNLAVMVSGSWIKVFLSFIVAFSAKTLSALAIAFASNLPVQEAIPIGVLSNTKSIIAVIILEIGQTQQVLSTQSYSFMMFASLMMTILVTPIAIAYRPSNKLAPYKRKTIQKGRLDDELRIIACLHDTRNIPAIINLLTTSHPTRRSMMSVFALQLVELEGRASAALVVHSSGTSSARNSIHSEAQVDQIISAFDNFELRSEGVTTQTMTARCNYALMDEDICNIARDKRAAFIILPFHKLNTPDGDMEEMNPAVRAVNESVLANAPCSVGMLIDRAKLSESHHDHARNVCVLYFGGPDDREALAFAIRMLANPDVNLTVVRIIPGTESAAGDNLGFGEDDYVTVHVDMEREKMLDDQFLEKFKLIKGDNESVSYIELVLNDEEEAINAIKSMDSQRFDLYIVGKGQGFINPLTTGLADWCDCPELGPIGDLLVTSEFESSFSVLVVQQYVKGSSTLDTDDSDSLSSSSRAFSLGIAGPSVAGSEAYYSDSSLMRKHSA